MNTERDHITILGRWHLDFRHAAGRAASRFLLALRDEQRLLASPCPKCGRVRIPPRDFCEDCFVATAEDWIEVGPAGVIEASTITCASFPGYRDPPHAIGYVRPEGASTAICNYVEGLDLADPASASDALAPGARVTAVFNEKRSAAITDFHWVLAPSISGTADSEDSG